MFQDLFRLAQYMTTYFVSRHPGAIEWAEQEGFHVDHQVTHLDPVTIKSGHIVIGSLPVNLAAEICARGGRYYHLSIDLTADLRGKELTPQDMRRCGARLEEFNVHAVKPIGGISA